MKLYLQLGLCIALSLLGTALSGPLDMEDNDNDEPERFTIQSHNPKLLGDTQVLDEGVKPEGNIMQDSPGAEDYVEEGEPSEIEEVQEQVEARIMCSNPSESN